MELATSAWLKESCSGKGCWTSSMAGKSNVGYLAKCQLLLLALLWHSYH